MCVDQLVNPTADFVPVHRGLPTKKHYVDATIFADHYSDFTYMHLMTDLDVEATVGAKQSIERLAPDYDLKIKHYHADNGLFDTKVFKQLVQVENQTLKFCGVNAHHQNGKKEWCIKDVTKGARMVLLHDVHR